MRVPWLGLRLGGVVVALAGLIAGPLPAQQGVVSGRVTSEQGNPLGGASVSVANTSVSVVTSADGSYRLTVPGAVPGRQVSLTARYIGHRPAITQVTLGPGPQTVNFSLSADPFRLDEVVVTGTAEAMEARKLSFAVARVTDEQLKEVPGANALVAIQGKVAGARLVPISAQPGSEVAIRLRGASSIGGRQDPFDKRPEVTVDLLLDEAGFQRGICISVPRQHLLVVGAGNGYGDLDAVISGGRTVPDAGSVRDGCRETEPDVGTAGGTFGRGSAPEAQSVRVAEGGLAEVGRRLRLNQHGDAHARDVSQRLFDPTPVRRRELGDPLIRPVELIPQRRRVPGDHPLEVHDNDVGGVEMRFAACNGQPDGIYGDETFAVVKRFQSINPHMRLVLSVTDAKGTRDIAFEGHSTNNMYRAGYRDGMIKVGDKITVFVAPLRDGSEGGYVTAALTASGKRFGPQSRACLERVKRDLTSEQRRELAEQIRRAIEPIDVAGLNDRARRNWYPVDAADLRGAAGRLGVDPTEIEALLQHSGFFNKSEDMA